MTTTAQALKALDLLADTNRRTFGSEHPAFSSIRQHIESTAAEIARLQAECENLRSVMIAAAEEIHEHWDAHCDAECYGPANLMRRLEEGIPAEYCYKAGDFERLQSELSTLRAATASVQADQRAEVERLRSECEALRKEAAVWKKLYRRAINEANGLTNYVEERPELRRAERNLTAIETDARALSLSTSTAPSGPIGAVREFFKRQDEERAALVKAGKCPTCHGDGVIGGQFCGGTYETCDACNGSGKPSSTAPSGAEE